MSKQVAFKFEGSEDEVDFEAEKKADIQEADRNITAFFNRWKAEYGVPQEEIDGLIYFINVLI